MTRQLFLSLVLALVLGMSARAGEQPPEPKPPPELRVLEGLVGAWDEETVAGPKERFTGTSTSAWMLGGWFLLTKARQQAAGHDTVQVSTFHPDRKEFVSWEFTAEGRFAEWRGQWDADSKTLTSQATFPRGNKGFRTIRLRDDSLTWSVQTKDPDGKVIFEIKKEAKRRKAPPEHPKEKPVQVNAGVRELKVLDRFVGEWSFDAVHEPAPWTPKEKRTTGATKNEWMLGGWFLNLQDKAGDKMTTFEVMTYDREKKSYRYWAFAPGGFAQQWLGQWNEGTKVLDFKGAFGDFVSEIAMRAVDDNSRVSTHVIRDRKGKIYFDAQTKLVRRQ